MSAKEQIQFRIVEITKISHFENDFHEFNLTKENLNDVGIELNHSLDILAEKNIVVFKISCVYQNNKNKEQKLFGLTAHTKFEVKELSEKYIDEKKNELTLPTKIIQTFLSISISSIRGMLAALNTNPVYQKMILPIINPKDLMKSNEPEH